MLLPLLLQADMFLPNPLGALFAGTSRTVQPAKAAAELARLKFSFLSRLYPGEIITSATTTVAVYSGVETIPTLILDGAPEVLGTLVIQRVRGGTSGVTYLLTCTAATQLGGAPYTYSYLLVQ